LREEIWQQSCFPSGTDVMILKKHFRQKWQNNWRFFKILLVFAKKLDRYIGFSEKRQFVRLELAKIAENCDHNIDPRRSGLMWFV
jgi:hypothetical protein